MHESWHRAVDSRDPRYDGVFFVAIATTKIYCRPVCPSRRANPANRRFFTSRRDAERAGFRACLRCRPELAPGAAECDALLRLATAAAKRIEAGALDGRSVRDLAGEFSVSERHLRRALGRALGVSPVELAQEHRLRLARRMLADTAMSITNVAYAAGFQSLRRFNAVFRSRHGMSPSAVRSRLCRSRSLSTMPTRTEAPRGDQPWLLETPESSSRTRLLQAARPQPRRTSTDR
jgi:AraC family transcriptional regulator of adaptative response / DNA-3-methyladenine glycosylase II